MNTLVVAVWLLAQQVDKPEQPTPLFMYFAPIVFVVMMAYLFIIAPQQREQKGQQSLLKSLSKNDRVETIGGILGTIVSISTDEKEVTLKVDDSTRIKFAARAIARKVGDETKTDVAPLK